MLPDEAVQNMPRNLMGHEAADLRGFLITEISHANKFIINLDAACVFTTIDNFYNRIFVHC